MFKLVKWMNQSIGVAWLYLITGIGLVIAGLYLTASTLDFLDNSIVTKGIVSELISHDGSYHPIVIYKDLSGDSKSFRSRFGCSPACYHKDEIVQVLIDSSGKSEPKIKGLFSVWGAHILLFGIGFIFSISSLIRLPKLKKESDKQLHNRQMQPTPNNGSAD
jgi:hypothetical protein